MLTTDTTFILNTSLLKYTPFSVFYTQLTSITENIGDWVAGNIPGILPLQRVVYKMLNKYQAPTFTSFSISGQGASLELGDDLTNPASFIWTTTNPSNINTNSLSITNVTGGNTVIASGLANDGSESVNIGTIAPITISATQLFTLKGINSQSTIFSRNLTFTWLPRRCYFVDSLDYITPSGNDVTITTKANSLTLSSQYELSSVRAMTKSFTPSAQYIYFIWDNTLGGDQNIFNVNGLPNTSWVFKSFTYINPFGITRTARIFRSLNILSANFNIQVL